MKRKVNRVGTSTLTVSLPSKWSKKHNMTPGMEIDLEEVGNDLLIKSGAHMSSKKKAVLNLDTMSKVLICRYLYEFYRQGVDEIELHFSGDSFHDHKNKKDVDISSYINKLVERYIGVEVVSQKKGKIMLQSFITQEDYNKIDIIQNRIFYLVKELLDEFIEAMKGDFQVFADDVYDYHDNIAKFTYYYLRLLNFSDKTDEQKSRLFALFTVMDRIIDKVRHTAERVNEMKGSKKKLIHDLDEIFGIFTGLFSLILHDKPNQKLYSELVTGRYEVVHRIKRAKYNEEEAKVIAESSIMLDTMNDCIETHIALTVQDYLVKP